MPPHSAMAAAGGDNAIHLFHHSFRGGGGKERYAIALVSALRQLGWEVTFHTMQVDQALADSLGVRLNVLRPLGVPRKLQDLWFYKQIAKLQVGGLHITLSRVRAKDLLISGGTHRGYLPRARKWAGPFDWLQFWLERQSYSFPRHIIAHSDLLTRDLQHYYRLPASKIVTLYPPVDDRFRQPSASRDPASLRKRFNWPSDKIVFLFPSSGHRRKGLAPIRNALGKFADKALLAVAGKRPAGGTAGFIQYLGYVEDLPEAYRAADFTILASYYEPFGLVGPESILCGTRLVFEKDIGCLPAILPELVFTFSVWDPASIENAIAKAITLAERKAHKIEPGTTGLTYNPDPVAHAQDVLKLLLRP